MNNPNNRNRDLDSDDDVPVDSEGFVLPPEEEEEQETAEEAALPPKRQHKYTTANLQPERPWKRWCLICLAFLVVIAIMVLLSIFLQKLFDPPEDEDWSDDEVNATVTDDDQAGALSGGGDPSLLPKTSEYVGTVCAEEKLSDDTTRQTCQQVCAPALDCCDPYASNNSSSACFQDQVAGCVTYSSCQALESTNDPPHNDLDRICSPASLEINKVDCELACTSLSCCYTDVENCVSLNFEACLDYAACQNLKAFQSDDPDVNAQYIAAAEPALEEECNNKEPMCGRSCREALCCSDPNSDCYRDNFVSCLTYATCNQYQDSTTRIAVAPLHARVDAAPANLRNVCLQSYIDTSGSADCEAVCAAATCCFGQGSDSCFGDDPLGCMEYRGCAVLPQFQR